MHKGRFSQRSIRLPVSGRIKYPYRILWKAVRRIQYPFQEPASAGQDVRRRRNLVHGWTNTPFASTLMHLYKGYAILLTAGHRYGTDILFCRMQEDIYSTVRTSPYAPTTTAQSRSHRTPVNIFPSTPVHTHPHPSTPVPILRPIKKEPSSDDPFLVFPTLRLFLTAFSDTCPK